MLARGTGDPFGGCTPKVDRRIGNAYWAVELVALNIDKIKYLAYTIGELAAASKNQYESVLATVGGIRVDLNSLDQKYTLLEQKIADLSIDTITGITPEIKTIAEDAAKAAVTTAVAGVAESIRTETGKTLADATARIIANQMVTARQYGASPNASPDVNTAAILKALQEAKNVFLHPGIYHVHADRIILRGGMTLQGAGLKATYLRAITPSGFVVSTEDFCDGFKLADLTLDRSVPAQPGGDGFRSGVIGDLGEIHRVRSTKNWNGFVLKGQGFGQIMDTRSDNNSGDGYLMYSPRPGTAIQWQFTGQTLAQANKGNGFHIISVPGGTTSISMGTMSGLNTYANGGHGFAVNMDEGYAVHGLRLNNYFFGDDGGCEIYLNSRGASHQFDSGYIELSGREGIFITKENHHVAINDMTMMNTGRSGVYTEAQYTTINNCQIFAAGLKAENANQAVGISLQAPACSVTGGNSGNYPGDNRQKVGVQIGAPYCTLTGVNLMGNGTAPVDLLPGSEATVLITGCQPADGLYQHLGYNLMRAAQPIVLGANNSGGAGLKALTVENS